MMLFEQWNRRALKNALIYAGWSTDFKARSDKRSGDQFHRFYGPKSRKNRTLRNAAIIEGLVSR